MNRSGYVVNNMVAVRMLLLGLLLIPLWSPTSVRADSQKDPDNTTAQAKLEAGDGKADKEESRKRSRPESLKFKIVRADDNSPVADARIEIHMTGRAANRNRQLVVNREIKADGDGIATLEYPDGTQPAYLWAMVRSSGFVPYYVNFGRSIEPASLPTEKTVRMEKGKKVGGIIVDPAGNPVAGAVVAISVPAADSPFPINYQLLRHTTGKDGLWELDAAPLDIKGLSIGTQHPRLLGKSFPIQDTVDGRYQLDEGVTLTGRVVDQQGQPIPDAQISIGRDRFGTRTEPIKVKQDGTYIVHTLRPESTWVTVESPKFAPQVKEVVIKNQMQPVDFELKPGQTTRFKIVDVDGTPIEGAQISADSWNTFRSLRWQAKTDADGFVAWDGAPADAVEFYALKEGYASLRGVVATPRDDPHIVTLPHPVKIQGIVTGLDQQKIPAFQVIPGRKYSRRWDVTWLNHAAANGQNGKFEISYDEACDEVYVRIEAPGYRPWSSDALSYRKNEHKLFVRLEPTVTIFGVVRSPNGDPADGAQLTLTTKSQGLRFASGYRPEQRTQIVKSDAMGHFQLENSEPENEFMITAVHENGYAELNSRRIEKSQDISLQSWAKVTVVVRRGKQPLPEAIISVEPSRQRREGIDIYSYGIEGVTDDQGRIVFDRVVPRNADVHQVLRRQRENVIWNFWERSSKLNLTPGAAIEVVLGGSGSVVSGRLIVHGKPSAAHQWSENDALEIIPAEDTDRPDRANILRCLIKDDGSFRVDDVPPGKYLLSVRVTAVPTRGQGGVGVILGMIEKEFEVPQNSQDVDLGTIEGSWSK